MRTEPDSPTVVRLVGVSSGSCSRDPGSTESSTSPELPRPLMVTESMLEMIEGWAANAATHGNLGAWQVLQAALLWRTQ